MVKAIQKAEGLVLAVLVGYATTQVIFDLICEFVRPFSTEQLLVASTLIFGFAFIVSYVFLKK